MASVQTVVWVCDKCGAEGDTDLITSFTVKNNNSPGRGRTFDVCGKCAKPLVDLLDKVKGASRKIPA